MLMCNSEPKNAGKPLRSSLLIDKHTKASTEHKVRPLCKEKRQPKCSFMQHFNDRSDRGMQVVFLH